MKPANIYILVFFLLLSLVGYPQGWTSPQNTFDTNWNMTFQVGRTALISEVNTNFKGSSNDMNNMSDWGLNFQLAKMIVNQLEGGLEIGYSSYKGYKTNPSNVNWLMLHTNFNNEKYDFLPYPIYYDSDLINFTLFVKYNFANFRTISKGYLKLNFYTKLGIGLALPSVEMGYVDLKHYEFTGLQHPIYIKGKYPRPEKDVHNFFSPAIGLNYQMTDRLFFSAETSLQLIGADNLDGIHNFNNKLTPDVPDHETPQFRIRVYDMTAKFLVGVTYYFDFDSTKGLRQKQAPFYGKQSQSYYSRYHRPNRVVPRSKTSKGKGK